MTVARDHQRPRCSRSVVSGDGSRDLSNTRWFRLIPNTMARVALTSAQRAALDRLDVTPGGVIFDPTLGPLCVDPLSDLGNASCEDVLDHARARGWSDEEAGRVNGAIELYYTLVASGVLPRDPYPDQ